MCEQSGAAAPAALITKGATALLVHFIKQRRVEKVTSPLFGVPSDAFVTWCGRPEAGLTLPVGRCCSRDAHHTSRLGVPVCARQWPADLVGWTCVFSRFGSKGVSG